MIYVYLGKLVTTGMQISATIGMIKKIDSEEEMAYVIPLEGGQGEWCSFGSLFDVSPAQRKENNL